MKHDLDVIRTLCDLEPFTKAIELKAGESLFRNSDGTLNESRERGLYFIEHGMLVSTYARSSFSFLVRFSMRLQLI